MSMLTGIGVSSYLVTQMYLHHFAGLMVIVLFIYIRLAIAGRIKNIVDPFSLMKITLALWIIVFTVGLNLYLTLWE